MNAIPPELPANIAFADSNEHDEFDESLDEDFVEDEDDEQETRGKKSSGGMPSWVIVVLAVGMLGAVGGLMYQLFFAGSNQAAEQIEVSSPVSVATVPAQPIITESASSSQAPNVGHSSPVPNAPFTPSAQPSSTQPAPAELQAIETRLQALEGRAAEIQSMLQSINESINILKAAKPQTLASARGPATPAAAPAARKPIESKPARGVQPRAAQATAGRDSQASAVVTPAAHDFDPEAYAITAIVGTRVWLSKRLPDGTDMEYSVVVGDRLEGRLVEQVDTQRKAVVLQGGARISTRY